jgi:hypothetical protein
VEWLKVNALSSSPSTAKKKKKKSLLRAYSVPAALFAIPILGRSMRSELEGGELELGMIAHICNFSTWEAGG